MKKWIALLLVMTLAISMIGCSGEPQIQETTATQPQQQTEPSTVAATEPPLIDTEEALKNALETQKKVTLDASLTLTTNVVVYEGTLDGNGNTLTGPAHVEGLPNTENGIAMQEGTLENITVVNAYRCVGDTPQNPQMGSIYLQNVTVDGPSYALNFGYGNFSEHLVVDDSTLLGWSSYTGFASATFTNCTFGWDSTGSNGNLRPYIDTILSGCRFEGKTAEDGSTVPFNISLRENIIGISITLEDCYVGDILITEENLHELLNIEAFDNKIYVSNTEAE